MTTVAYRDGVIAVDSRTTYGGSIATDRAEKIVVTEGRVFAVIGITAECHTFIANLVDVEGNDVRNADGSPVDCTIVDDGTAVVELLSCGDLRVYEKGGSYPYKRAYGFRAFGSGAAAATAAMHCGMLAHQAVEVAARVDPYTGGNVWTAWFDPMHPDRPPNVRCHGHDRVS